MGTEKDHQQGDMSSDYLKQLAAQREKEWKDVQELRTQSLEAALREKNKELDEVKAKFQKLKEDFKYNLKILGERDAELDRYDSIFTELKTSVASRDAEVSDLKIKIDDLQKEMIRERQSKDELQMHYQHRIREKQSEVEQYKSTKDVELQSERKEVENYKRNLERQLREMEDEIDTQRRELTTEFEEAMRKREHEYRVQADEMSSTVLAHELKVKLLQKEMETLKCSQETRDVEYERTESSCRDMEKKVKQAEWEVADVRAMSDAKIKDLESKIHQIDLSLKRAQEDFQRKQSELDRTIKEKDLIISKLREGAKERENQLDLAIRNLQSRLEEANVKVRQAEWSRDDAESERAMHIEKLQMELNEMKDKWDHHTKDISRENVSRDMELQALRDSDYQHKATIAQLKDDIQRYKKELSLAADRESDLEKAKSQLELDWQRRCDGVETKQYEKSEDLVRKLTKARDDSQAEAKECRRLLEQREDLLKVMKEDRNKALATLKQHGVSLNRNIDLSEFEDLPPSAMDQIDQLQSQNDNLRMVIHQMRQQMETLGDTMPRDTSRDPRDTLRESPVRSVRVDSVTQEYVRNIETELKELKKKYRRLEQTKSDAQNVELGEVMAVPDVHSDNVVVKTHIEQLNNTIGALRKEKVELSATVMKQQARIQHLESTVDDLYKQPREKQVEIDQLKYELSATTRRKEAETASLRQRISDLELQLVEARKEADEYYKGTLERNLEVTALGQQISQLKMELAEGRPALNFGAQELVIQQLKEEIQRLRKLDQGDGYGTTDTVTRGPNDSAELRNKLKMAVKHIGQLTKEKQLLIEMGNRLRAELNKNGISAPGGSRSQTNPLIQPPVLGQPNLHEKIQTKLSQLEKLQYELTKQELSYNQKYVDPPRAPMVPTISVDRSSTEGESEEELPRPILKKPSKKLSPVPENSVPPARPRTAPSDYTQPPYTGDYPRPHTARSEPTTHRSSSPQKEGANPHLVMSMSSVGGESLQEIWNMLDEGPSPRGFSPMTSMGSGPFQGLMFPGDDGGRHSNEPTPSSSMVLQGKQPSFHSRPQPPQMSTSPRTAGRVLKKMPVKDKPKIRNWNVKDNK